MPFILGQSILGEDTLGIPLGSVALGGVVLSRNLIWTDRMDWDPVVQTVTETAAGGVVIEEFVRLAGRPITLSGDWLKPETVDQLVAMKETPEFREVLTLQDGSQYWVTWRHEDGALDADPVFALADPSKIELYAVVLRFLEVPK